ncbi:hypothetical protein GW17_00010995 [Ensete ventricosum]|nr:hypothetical protein GW17_00010995 [Ensete ventricosum]
MHPAGPRAQLATAPSHASRPSIRNMRHAYWGEENDRVYAGATPMAIINNHVNANVESWSLYSAYMMTRLLELVQDNKSCLCSSGLYRKTVHDVQSPENARSDAIWYETMLVGPRHVECTTQLLEALAARHRPQEIRRSVAVSNLAGKKQNALRVAGIPGAMESISSLLYTGRSSSNLRPDEVSRQFTGADHHADHEFLAFNLLGLLILKKFAKDHDNCGKIGNTRGLLATIIDFTGGGERLGRRESATESQVKAVKRSHDRAEREALRQEMLEIMFTISNTRESHVMLQKLGIETLTNLAMEDEARERIGSTGRMIKELLWIFSREGLTQQQKHGEGRSRGGARYADIGEQEQLLQDSECGGKAG